MSEVELVPALVEHEPVLANLIELYAHDFSEFQTLDVGEDGRFGYPGLSLYWSEAWRSPFLIRNDGRWAGLVLVKRGPSVLGDGEVWDMAEFFVLRGYRRMGVGGAAASEVWNRFAGAWEVRVMEANAPAVRFWGTAIARFVEAVVDPDFRLIDGKGWRVFSFESKDVNET